METINTNPYADDDFTQASEHLRLAISSGELRDKGTGLRYGKITISIGIAPFHENARPNDLIRRADQALYQAKERGRNRVEKAT